MLQVYLPEAIVLEFFQVVSYHNHLIYLHKHIEDAGIIKHTMASSIIEYYVVKGRKRTFMILACQI